MFFLFALSGLALLAATWMLLDLVHVYKRDGELPWLSEVPIVLIIVMMVLSAVLFVGGVLA